MCRAVIDLGLQGKIRLIGNDCFAESAVLLREGILTAIIDKKTMQQGHLAAQTLFNYVVKTEYPASNVLLVRPSVVMQSNIDAEMMFE
jgi:LacI family transcriptional regulator